MYAHTYKHHIQIAPSPGGLTLLVHVAPIDAIPQVFSELAPRTDVAAARLFPRTRRVCARAVQPEVRLESAPRHDPVAIGVVRADDIQPVEEPAHQHGRRLDVFLAKRLPVNGADGPVRPQVLGEARIAESVAAGRVHGVGQDLDTKGAEERLVHVVRIVVEVFFSRLVPLPAHLAHYDVASDALDACHGRRCRHEFGHFILREFDKRTGELVIKLVID